MQKYFVPYFLRMVALTSIFERLVLLEAEAPRAATEDTCQEDCRRAHVRVAEIVTN